MNQENPFVVAIIFSDKTLSQICQFLEDYVDGRKEDVGVMRIDRNRGRETNRGRGRTAIHL